jgi:phosphate transport system substrate-binding protein
VKELTVKSKERFFPALLAWLLLVAGQLTANPALAAPGKLTLTGTGSAIGVMQILGREFRKKHPDTVIEVLPSIGSSGGIKAAREGKIDLGLSARQLKPEERTGTVEEAYGRSAFVFAVNSEVPDNGVTLKEIEEIYLGKRTTWRDGSPIRLVLRPVHDSYSIYLAGINRGLKTASDKSHTIPGVFVGSTDNEAALQIEKTPGAFGVTSACLITAEQRKIKTLAVDGKMPTLANAASGAYPYTMNLYLVYRQDSRNPALKQFVDFIFSDAGRKILTRTDHVALKRGPRR